MNAADLAAQIVAGARVAAELERRQQEFRVLEVCDQASHYYPILLHHHQKSFILSFLRLQIINGNERL